MTAALLVLATASAYPELFWGRDLGSLARSIAEDAPLAQAASNEGQRLFFSELVAFCSCRALPPLDDAAPEWAPRALLRLEASRRARLETAPLPTLWRALSGPDPFRRATGNPPAGVAQLAWPQEEESWSGERLLVAEPLSACSKPAPRQDELAAASVAVLARLSKEAEAGPPLGAALARVRFHRAVLLQRAGQAEPARAAARAVQPELLDAELVPWARLLRLELGVDEAEGWVSLARERGLGDAQLLALLRSSDVLLASGRAAEFVALAAEVALAPAPRPALPPEQPREATPDLGRILRYRLALAQLLAGRSGEALALLNGLFPRGAEASALDDALEDLALRALASSGDPAWALRRLEETFPGDALIRARSLLASRALASGNTALADASARAMLKGADRLRWQGIALSARSAFARNDPRAFLTATSPLLPQVDPPGITLRDRAERNFAALAVLGAAVEQEASSPRAGWRQLLVAQLARARDSVSLRSLPALERLSLVLASSAELPARGTPPVALGTVTVEARPATVPLPPLTFAFPDPFSLLAIPTSDGSLRSWFDRP